MHYVIYSNTEFLDILKIQTDYLKEESKTLLINKNNLDLSHLYNSYENVIFYEEELPYASRILKLFDIKNKYKYVIFIHDIDIVLEKDNLILSKIINIMEKYKIDRVDLQNAGEVCDEEFIDILDEHILFSKETLERNKFFLARNTKGDYVYNVNPSIWNLDSFLGLLKNFFYLSYRNIELDRNLQFLIKNKYKVYQLFTTSNNKVKCGYFSCMPFFQFFHITHGGLLVPNLIDLQENSISFEINKKYQKILEKYFFNSSRKFRKKMGD